MTNAKNIYESKSFSFGERLSYALANIGGNLVYTTISSFVTLYYTGVAGLLIPMIGDVIDYGELQNGMRLDGLTNSVSSLGIKLGTGLGSALVGWLLAWGAYQAGAEVQPESALIAMRMLVGGIPAIVSLIGVIFSFFFNVERDVENIRASR